MKGKMMKMASNEHRFAHMYCSSVFCNSSHFRNYHHGTIAEFCNCLQIVHVLQNSANFFRELSKRKLSKIIILPNFSDSQKGLQ